MKPKMMFYNEWHDPMEVQTAMPKKKVKLEDDKETFGDRLAKLRKAAGYSLRGLAAELGSSPRMLVYYEKHSGNPSAHFLPPLANALGVSTDQLLGIEKVKSNGRIKDTKLWRRFSQIEKLSPAQRRPMIQLMDTFLRGVQK